MTYLKSLPDADLKQVLRLQPAAGVPLAQYHEALMRGPSPFTEGERELIAAFVSGLNDCDFCTQEHGAVAVAFGISPGLLGGLLEDLETAAVAEFQNPSVSCAATSRPTWTPPLMSVTRMWA